MKFTYMFIAIFGMALSAVSQNRHYVYQVASGANTGQSWTDAYTSLQTALLAAVPGDEIWVAEGTYRPTNTTDRSISFEPAGGVRLYGGFAGMETDLAQRDWQAHPVVLSGDIGVAGDSIDNTYNVVYLFEPDSNTVLDGFVICYGNANVGNANSFSRLRSGGGLYIMGEDADAYPEIRNCTFILNTARSFGGAVMAYGGGDGSVAPRLVNCRFEDNRAVGSGGGVARIGGSWVERGKDLEGCIFLRNRAGFRGGGFYYLDSERSDQLDIHGCTFEENKATDDGGGAYLAVGRIIPSGYSITTTIFRNNEATDGAAFISMPNTLLYGSILNVDSCEFYDHLLTIDGIGLPPAVAQMEMLASGTSVGKVKNCNFQGNSGWVYIATVLLDNAQIIIENINMSENESNELLFPANGNNKLDIINSTFIKNNFKASICSNTGDRVLYSNCLFTDNASEDGVLMRNSNVDTLLYQNCTINGSQILSLANMPGSYPGIFLAQNSIFTGVADIRRFTDSKIHSQLLNCYFDTIDCSFLSLFDITCGPGIITGVSPLFINPDSGDYRLQPCSPLRDAGNNTFVPAGSADLAGLPRIQGGAVDIGAYEASAFGLAAEPLVKPACAGLANGAVTVLLLGACEPLAVTWSSGSTSGATLDGLAPGTYAFTVTDVQGRSLVFGAGIPQANPPMLQIDGDPISCHGANDARLAVIPLTGQPPFAYLWAPSGVTDSANTQLGPGPVSVTVTDAWGCTSTYSFDIQEPDSLYVIATVQDVSGPQASDGSILVNSVFGGTAPYDYLWAPGGSTGYLLSNLPPGQYSLTLSDERGCELVQVFEVKFVSGIEDLQAAGVLLIYPNPASGHALVEVSRPDHYGACRAELFDATGRLVGNSPLQTGPSGIWSLALEGLASGQYVVRLTDKDGRAVGYGKLVKH